MNLMNLLLIPSACIALVACATDVAEPELVIDHADDTSVVGEYRTADSVVKFESRTVGNDVAAAFFDEQGVRLAATYPGKTPPADWGAGAGEDRQLDESALELIPAAAQALAAEGIAGTDALLTLGGAGDVAPPSEDGSSHGRCDRYVEYTAYSYTGIPCTTALNYLRRWYAPCNSWLRWSWQYWDYEDGRIEYGCVAAAIY